jgi:hypothetical protein
MRIPLFQYQARTAPLNTAAPALDPSTLISDSFNPDFLFQKLGVRPEQFALHTEPVATPALDPSTLISDSFNPDLLFKKVAVRPEQFALHTEPIQNPINFWDHFQPDQYLRPDNRRYQFPDHALDNREAVRPDAAEIEWLFSQPTNLKPPKSRQPLFGAQFVEPAPEVVFVDKWLGNQPASAPRRPANATYHLGNFALDFSHVLKFLNFHATIPNPLPELRFPTAAQQTHAGPIHPAIRLDWYFQQPDQPARPPQSLSSPERVTEPPRVVTPSTDALYVQAPDYAARRAPAPVNVGIQYVDPGALLRILDFDTQPTDYLPPPPNPTLTTGISILDPGSIHRTLDWNTPQPDPVHPPLRLTPEAFTFVPPPALYIYDPAPLGWYAPTQQPYRVPAHHPHLDPALFFVIPFDIVIPPDPDVLLEEVTLHFTAPANKLDFTINVGVLDFATPANKLDFTLLLE